MIIQKLLHSPHLPKLIMYTQTFNAINNVNDVLDFRGSVKDSGPEPIWLVDCIARVYEWSISMAKKTSQWGVEFIDLRLNQSDKKDFDAWVKVQTFTPLEFLWAVTQEDYKASISHDSEHSCFVVALTGKPTQTHNPNLCLTSRSDDLEEAIMLTAFKHTAICHSESWGQPASTTRSWG